MKNVYEPILSSRKISRYGTSFDFERYKKDYVTLYVDTIRRVVRDLDRERPFIVSSPSNGLESEEEGYIAANPYSDLYGDGRLII